VAPPISRFCCLPVQPLFECNMQLFLFIYRVNAFWLGLASSESHCGAQRDLPSSLEDTPSAYFKMADCAEIKTSKIHANLDRDKLFGDGWWLEYCCCYGVAIGDVSNPLFGSEARNLCLHKTCQQVDFGNPFCSGLSVCLFCTNQCAFPKIDGSPVCVCCNKQLAGGDTGSWKPSLFEFTPGFGDQFWLYYFLCGGASVHGLSANGRPMLGALQKQFCVEQATKCVAPVQNGVLCSGVGTCLCFWNQMQFPPAENNPKIGCCGWKMNKYNPSGKAAAPMGYGKPGQTEMN
jgi:hypothetical protein